VQGSTLPMEAVKNETHRGFHIQLIGFYDCFLRLRD
jgi:hypothetical protein